MPEKEVSLPGTTEEEVLEENKPKNNTNDCVSGVSGNIQEVLTPISRSISPQSPFSPRSTPWKDLTKIDMSDMGFSRNGKGYSPHNISGSDLVHIFVSPEDSKFGAGASTSESPKLSWKHQVSQTRTRRRGHKKGENTPETNTPTDSSVNVDMQTGLGNPLISPTSRNLATETNTPTKPTDSAVSTAKESSTPGREQKKPRKDSKCNIV